MFCFFKNLLIVGHDLRKFILIPIDLLSFIIFKIIRVFFIFIQSSFHIIFPRSFDESVIVTCSSFLCHSRYIYLTLCHSRIPLTIKRGIMCLSLGSMILKGFIDFGVEFRFFSLSVLSIIEAVTHQTSIVCIKATTTHRSLSLFFKVSLSITNDWRCIFLCWMKHHHYLLSCSGHIIFVILSFIRTWRLASNKR